jgi:G:T-mismatch repair DNA endonuclease (very short patch repair protein)
MMTVTLRCRGKQSREVATIINQAAEIERLQKLLTAHGIPFRSEPPKLKGVIFDELSDLKGKP